MKSKWIWFVQKLCVCDYGTPDTYFQYCTPCSLCAMFSHSASTDNGEHLTIWYICPLLHFMYSWTVWHWPAANSVRACCMAGWKHRRNRSLRPVSGSWEWHVHPPQKNKRVAESWAAHCRTRRQPMTFDFRWQLVWLQCWKEGAHALQVQVKQEEGTCLWPIIIPNTPTQFI